jgi:hypothetical protein
VLLLKGSSDRETGEQGRQYSEHIARPVTLEILKRKTFAKLSIWLAHIARVLRFLFLSSHFRH